MSDVTNFNISGQQINIKDPIARKYIPDIERLKNKKYILIGDSYGTELHHSWIKKVAELKGLVNERDYWFTAFGGACWGTGKSNMNFITLLEQVSKSLSTEQKTSITDVVIQGSVNDWNSTEFQIKEGLERVQNFVNSNFPNAAITIPLIGWSYESDDIRIGTAKAYGFINSYATNCKVCNDLFTPLLNRYFLDSDATHPTDAGSNLLASNIVNALNGGNYFNNVKYNDLNCNIIGLNKDSIKIYGNVQNAGYNLYKNDQTGLRFDNSPITITKEGTLIGSCTNPAQNNLFMNECSIPCMTLLNVKPNNFKMARTVLHVKRRPNQMAWDVYLQSSDILSTDYPIENVIGVYIQFNAFIDIFHN